MFHVPHGKSSVYWEFPIYTLFGHCPVIWPKCDWATVTVVVECSEHKSGFTCAVLPNVHAQITLRMGSVHRYMSHTAQVHVYFSEEI